MKKKHELLKYAYDNYPKGTKFKSLLRKDITESTGNFFIDGTGGVAESPTGRAIYFRHKWAEIIQESILSGKCAIQVNNEREFKLLMEYYNSKGWKWLTQESYNTVITEEDFNDDEVNIISYHDKCTFMNQVSNYNCEELGYKIIPFSEFAIEVGIEVPVFVMTSEDGVPLYVGDKYAHAYYSDMPHQWMLGVSKKGLEKDCLGVTNPKEVKVFSNVVEADKWISEMNKPKSIRLFDGQPVTVVVTKHGFESTASQINHNVHGFESSDLEEIYTAYKSLQS